MTLWLLLLETSYCVPTPETSQEPRGALFTHSGAHSRLEVLWKCEVDSVGPAWLRVCVSNKTVIPRGLVGGSREAVTWRGASRPREEAWGVSSSPGASRAGKNGGSLMAR